VEDSARLSGEALRRWYARSSAEVERERQNQIELERRRFFGAPTEQPYRPTRAVSSSDRPVALLFEAASPATGQTLEPSIPARLRNFVPAERLVARQLESQPRASVGSCVNCHGHAPLPLPPPFGALPFLPPLFRVGPSPFPLEFRSRSKQEDESSSLREKWSERPQCNQQFEADRIICQRAKSPTCWENQTKRLGHCDITGEVGTPPLKFGPPGR
jgi:hypothetical protein